MIKKINCIYNENNAFCTHKNVKRSLCGLGARVCLEHNDKPCKFKVSLHKSAAPPPPPKA